MVPLAMGTLGRRGAASCVLVGSLLLVSCASTVGTTDPTSASASMSMTSGATELDQTSVTVFEANATRGFGGGASSATIEYALPSAGHVKIVVLDASGRELGTVLEGWRPAGRHSADFSVGYGRRQVATYRVEWGEQTVTGRIPVGP